VNPFTGVTVTVYAALAPAFTFCVDGLTEMVKFSTHNTNVAMCVTPPLAAVIVIV
jgi:hypothetical protein